MIKPLLPMQHDFIQFAGHFRDQFEASYSLMDAGKRASFYMCEVAKQEDGFNELYQYGWFSSDTKCLHFRFDGQPYPRLSVCPLDVAAVPSPLQVISGESVYTYIKQTEASEDDEPISYALQSAQLLSNS